MIGKGGEVREEIEEKSGAVLDINSKTGSVDIDTSDIDDPLLEMSVEDVVKAIGRGFNPEKAISILNENVHFELMDIRDYVGKNANAVRRMRGRVIGKDGRSRELIEELSESYVSVYGNTIGIIGGPTELKIARKAVEMLLQGSEHASVYRFLENSREEIKIAKSGFHLEEDIREE